MSAAASTPLQTTPESTTLKVLIVGAGLGGLMLAALLERAGVDYEIFERAKKVVPLGSAIAFGANIMSLFEQLGVLDKIMENSKAIHESILYNENNEVIGRRVFSYAKERYGHYTHVLARPVLYDLLLSLIPAHKVHMATKIISFTQDDNKVTIECEDKTFQGDMLVGADGAYSTVREQLYKQLSAKGAVPESDLEKLPFTSSCLVGTTRPLDPEKYPFLTKPFCHFANMIANPEIPYSRINFSVKDNSICWMIVDYLLDKESTKADEAAHNGSSGKNSEWGPGAAEAMCNRVRNFMFAEKVSIGELIDQTPKELISKVMLEEKLFETWYSGRTVLLGDACHKMHPAAGLGAVSAMHDALILANHLYDLNQAVSRTMIRASTIELEGVFKDYRDERFPMVARSFAASKNMSRLTGPYRINQILRWLMNYIPRWLWFKMLDQMQAYRPQATFLPLVKDLGMIPPMPQTSLKQPIPTY
ncbi:hypothetical protein BGW38_001761 [Lunasporangiospora selenospora]|uniref:FAD-binding domain-containing protein n=1 Tax=Lunasporangiospora selenospora TaxID=979761 RepID=A0A9P6FTJ1_9FUNG|nr:hypothetical protein BGW38_001761 [Lunasporangiospora selenospora]